MTWEIGSDGAAAEESSLLPMRLCNKAPLVLNPPSKMFETRPMTWEIGSDGAAALC